MPSTVTRERALIQERTLDEDDRRLLEEFDEKLSAQLDNPGEFTHIKYLRGARLFAERESGLDRLLVTERAAADVGVSPEQETAREAVESYIGTLKARDYTGSTLDGRITSLRKFINTFAAVDRIPDAETYLSPTHADTDPTPAPGSILFWAAHIVPMLEAADSWRDKAIIALAWSSGMRPESELHKLNVGDITDAGDHLVISVRKEAKTGARDVRVTVGAPYVRKWLQEHPARKADVCGPSTPLWVSTRPGYANLGPNQRLKYGGFQKRFLTLGDRAGITRPHYPRNFRRSRASVLAMKPGISQADLETYFGWVRGSSAAAHYIARFSDRTGAKVARAEGFETEEAPEDDPITPVECPDCKRLTPRFREQCLWCPAQFDVDDLADARDVDEVTDALDRGDEFTEVRDDVIRMVTNGDLTEEDIQTARDLERAVRCHPDLLDQAAALRQLLDQAG